MDNILSTVPTAIKAIVGTSMREKTFRRTLNMIRARLIEERGLPEDLVDRCMKLSLQWTICEATGIRECDVYHEEDGNWLVVAHLHIPSEASPERAYWVREPVYNTTLSLPGSADFWAYNFPHLKGIWEDKFVHLMKCGEGQELLRKLRTRVHTAVLGWPLLQWGSRIAVLLKEESDKTPVVGWMDKAEEVPREGKMRVYDRGQLFFYLLSVKKVPKDYEGQSGYGWNANLSRASKNLPAALIRRYAPWIKAKGVKRIIGKKSWVRCNKHPGPEVLKKVSRELMGEVIEVV